MDELHKMVCEVSSISDIYAVVLSKCLAQRSHLALLYVACRLYMYALSHSIKVLRQKIFVERRKMKKKERKRKEGRGD